MANVKKTTEDNILESNISNNDDILSLLKAMQLEIASIKDSNEKLKEENNKLVQQNNKLQFTQETNNVQDNNSEKKERKLDPNMEVVIINMFDGLMFNMKINDLGAVKVLNKFGQKIWVTLKEARDIVRLNDKFVRLGYFIFEDRDVIEDLLLEEDYMKIIDVKTLDRLPDLENKVFESVFKNANQMYQEKIINKFVDEYIKGQDGRFRDRKKIDLLSDWSGQDLMLKITETERANQLKG